MSSNTQLSLNIPFSVNLKLDRPLYFRKENVKCGNVSQLALAQGHYLMTAIHKQGLQHELVSEDGLTFEAELVTKKGVSSINGKAKLINKPRARDFNLEGVGHSGLSLRKAQIGAVHSLLAHWSLSKKDATVVLPTGTGKTETMLVTTLADRATRTLV